MWVKENIEQFPNEKVLKMFSQVSGVEKSVVQDK